MKNGPLVSDYGGNRYGSRYRTRQTKETCESHRCRDCGTLRYVTRRELLRAARPRCMACGGTLVETDSEASRHKEERRKTVFADPERGYRCRACGQNLGSFSGASLSAHLHTHPDCVDYQRREGFIVAAFNERSEIVEFIYGTTVAGSCEGGWKWRFAVYALAPDGSEIVLRKFMRLYEAKRFQQATAASLESIRENPIPSRSWDE